MVGRDGVVSNRVVQMQYRASTATALDSWDAYAGRSIREGERGGGGGQWVGVWSLYRGLGRDDIAVADGGVDIVERSLHEDAQDITSLLSSCRGTVSYTRWRSTDRDCSWQMSGAQSRSS